MGKQKVDMDIIYIIGFFAFIILIILICLDAMERS